MIKLRLGAGLVAYNVCEGGHTKYLPLSDSVAPYLHSLCASVAVLAMLTDSVAKALQIQIAIVAVWRTLTIFAARRHL